MSRWRRTMTHGMFLASDSEGRAAWLPGDADVAYLSLAEISTLFYMSQRRVPLPSHADPWPYPVHFETCTPRYLEGSRAHAIDH